ncbi:CoA transferase [Tateyamaria pelophila]|uniref:CoA transferase n=1 Tax=Tateyamaria pelophila TaxID=328415 RepID=UPI001CBD1220|nr:CoA transferase [Tateyamaria pelophila]
MIKVEAVERGDLTRQLGADPALSEANMGVSFLAQNTDKKSVTGNLKVPQGRTLFLKLLCTAYVFVGYFRPGVMKR